jgi:hypothetical protein
MPLPLRKSFADYVEEIAGQRPLNVSYAPTTDTGNQVLTPTNPQLPSQTTSIDTSSNVRNEAALPQTSGAPIVSTAQTQPGEAYKINLREYAENPEIKGVYSELFAPISKQLKESYGKLGESTKEFLQGAGNRRTFESLGGTPYLEELVGGQGDITPAKEMISAKYAGPEQLTQEDLDDLISNIYGLKQYGGALQTPGGIEELMRQRAPGLTPGELKFETANLRKEPEFQKSLQAEQSDINQMISDYLRVQEEAKSIAGQRGTEESDIASQTKSFMEGKVNPMTEAWDKAVAEAQASNTAAQAAYDQFMKTGSIADLDRLQQVVNASGWDASKFNTKARQTYNMGAKEWNKIYKKYKDIADIPLMTLQFTERGNEIVGFDPTWWEAHQNDYSEDKWAKLKQRAYDRQTELEKAGFSSYDIGGMRSIVEDTGNDYTEGTKAGKYSLFNPLYIGQQKWKPGDIRSYVGTLELKRPSRETVSTQEQRNTYNRIQEILGSLENSVGAQITDPTETYAKASVTAELGRYLKDEKASLESQKKKLTDQQREWRDLINEAHDRWVDLQRRERWESAWDVFAFPLGDVFGEHLMGEIGTELNTMHPIGPGP